MADRDSLTASRARELLNYSRLTGVFTWRVTRGRAVAGTLAGWRDKVTQRNCIGIDGHNYRANRLAWLWITGEWPLFEVDHIDTDPSNDAWLNLRDVTTGVNHQNLRAAKSHNTTGYLGVYRNHNFFSSKVVVAGKVHYTGCFTTPLEAHLAYVAKKRELHPGNTL